MGRRKGIGRKGMMEREMWKERIEGQGGMKRKEMKGAGSVRRYELGRRKGMGRKGMMERGVWKEKVEGAGRNEEEGDEGEGNVGSED